MNDPDVGIWTTISAVIVAFITGVIGPYIVARLHLRSKGITPEEMVQATNRVGFRHHVDETARLAVEIAHDAQDTAAKAEKEAADMTEKNKQLTGENEELKRRVVSLELIAKRIPKLEAEIKRLRQQVRNYKRRKS